MRNIAGPRTGVRARRQWLRVAEVEYVEIVADDRGDRSWATALVNVFVPYGDVYVRFVARERGPGLRGLKPVHVSDPFPAARAGLDDQKAQGAWLGIQQARLLDLQRKLLEDGWEPAGHGEHWWSARYSRPRPAAAPAAVPGRRAPRPRRPASGSVDPRAQA